MATASSPADTTVVAASILTNIGLASLQVVNPDACRADAMRKAGFALIDIAVE